MDAFIAIADRHEPVVNAFPPIKSFALVRFFDCEPFWTAVIFAASSDSTGSVVFFPAPRLLDCDLDLVARAGLLAAPQTARLRG
jgi:hypothetical protein